MAPALLLATVVWLAYANGANDNFKGVATLFGTGTSDYRRALRWATFCTLLGSLASLLLAGGLLATFQGKGLVPDEITAGSGFRIATVSGAAATVFLASRLGLPISTTHALVGALVGAGLAAAPSTVNLDGLGRKFTLPLLVSPLVSLTAAAVLYRLFHALRFRLGVARETCLCIGQEVRVLATEGPSCCDAGVLAPIGAPSVSIGNMDACFERYAGRVVGVNAQTALNAAHYASAGAVSFARGLNDTPKIAAILAASALLAPGVSSMFVAGAIALGGILGARRVADTMSHRITTMNHGQGFTANLVTALLVIFASRSGLPVSTTHVSCGALFGIGTATGGARWRTILGILAAWVTTLPLAAALAAGIFALAG